MRKKGQDSRTTESVVLRRDIQVKSLWGPYRMALKYKNMLLMPDSGLLERGTMASITDENGMSSIRRNDWPTALSDVHILSENHLIPQFLLNEIMFMFNLCNI